MDNQEVIINPTTCHEMIQSLSEKLRASYVFPDIAEEICDHLQEHLADGDYADITDGELLALALTMHLQEVNQDKHLWIQYHQRTLPDQEDQRQKNPQWKNEQQLLARLDNFGIYKVERLPGSVGYLEIRKFHPPAWGGDTAVAAMNFLANTEALIIDLRKCEGGSPDMIALISSYLFGSDPVHLNNIYWRDEEVIKQYWTLPFVPGQRSDKKPIFILTSKDTFSGGEEFAYNLKTRKRALLVGETTGGGAHPGALFRLNAHLECSFLSGAQSIQSPERIGKGLGLSLMSSYHKNRLSRLLTIWRSRLSSQR